MAENSKKIGALEFEVLMKTGDIQKQAKQTEELIKGIAKVAGDVGKSVDQMATEIVKPISDMGNNLKTSKEQIIQFADAGETAGKAIKKPMLDVADTISLVGDKFNRAKSDEENALASITSIFNENEKRIKSLNDELAKQELLLKKIKESGGSDKSVSAQNDNIAKIREEIKARQDLQKEIKETLDALKDTNETIKATDGSKMFDGVPEKLKEVTGLSGNFGESLIKLGKGGKEGKEAFLALGDGVKAFGKTLWGLMTNPAFLAIAGVAGVAAGFKWWFDYNKGVEEATRKTQQLTGLAGTELKDFRAEVSAIADTFGKEYDEVLLATNALTKQMGIDAKEALDIVKDGFIVGADVNDEYLDTLREYPAYFKEAGLNAKQFVAITAMGAKEGVFSDKAVDAIKEANLRLREMPQATQDAVNGLGLSAKTIMKELEDGSTTTFEVMQKISKRMSELPAQSSAIGTAMADIWGGPGEDAGLAFLTNLQYVNGDLEKMKEECGEVATIQDKLLNSNIELEQKIAEVFDSTGGFFESITSSAKMLLNEYLVEILDWLQECKNEFIEFWNANEGFRQTLGVLANHAGNIIKTTLKGLKLLGSTIWNVAQLANPANWFDTDLMKKKLTNLGNAFADYGKQVGKTFSDLFTGEGSGIFQKIDDKIAKVKTKTKENSDDPPKDVPETLASVLEKRKKQYEEYAKAIASENKFISENAQKSAKELLKNGATWEEYLNKIKDRYKGNAEAMKLIINELLALEKHNLMDVFNDDLEVATQYARNTTEQYEVIRKIRAQIAKDDPLASEKNDVLDEQLRSLLKNSEMEVAEAKNGYKDFLDEKLKESEKYARQISQIEVQYAKATSDKEKKILENQLEATTARYNLAVAKEQIDNARNLTDELVRIETERQTRLKAVRNDASKSAEERTAEQDRINEYADAEIEVLRGKYEVAGLEFSDTLQKSVGNAMNKTLAEYVKIIPDLEKELAKLDPNTDEYIKLSATLEALKKGFQNLKDTQNKTCKDFSKKEKWTKVAGYIGEIGNALQDLGGQFKGTTGDIMSLTGELFTSTATIIGNIQKVTDIVTKSIEGVSQATATSIKAVESASVILEVIAVAMQVAMKIVDLFNKNKQTYEDKKDTYQAYVSTLDTIISREKELTKTLEAQQAVAQYDAVGQMIEKQAESTRRIAKDYLNDRSRGEHTHGVQQTDKLNSADWAELRSAIGYSTGKSIENKGRLVGLFDLSAEDLKKVQTMATGFYSKLDDETRGYIESIIQYSDNLTKNTKEKMEQINGISFESFADNFVSALEDMEATAEDISKDISEQMRKGLINDMFKREYAQKLQEYYDAWYEDAKDGKIDDQNYLNGLRDSIVNGAVESAKAINDMFRDTTEDIENDKTLSGAIKGASQESIDLLAGQTNAVRMNQVEQIAILRAQTETMNAVNDSIIRNGMILSDILDAVRNSGVNMRSQGLGI